MRFSFTSLTPSFMFVGGEEILYQYAGKDVTEDFYGLHRIEVLKKYNSKLKIGTLEGEKSVSQKTYDEVSAATSCLAYCYLWSVTPPSLFFVGQLEALQGAVRRAVGLPRVSIAVLQTVPPRFPEEHP